MANLGAGVEKEALLSKIPLSTVNASVNNGARLSSTLAESAMNTPISHRKAN